ncbi:MAG TPA: GGDEF domain-containing protein [Candidatus Limnocylindrales bacterium]|nr:GGDEF domain-containing protein [Candidatus Limnocylindrales bacterium]
MDADFARERRRILLALMMALTAGFLPIIMGTWLAATRTEQSCPAPTDLGTFGFSLAFGALSCLAIVALAVIVINRYHRTLLRAATRDHVTGAYNRHAFEAIAEDAISSATRTEQPLSVVLFDLDDFKRYNDTHGHNAGDAALREVARVATTVVRRSDVVGRWGGDEFVLLLPLCDATAAARIAGSLAAAVQDGEPERAGRPAPISISTGVAELRPTDRLSDVVARADDAMYRSRRARRAASQRPARRSPTRR